jgi:hypothetical protein
MPFKYCLDFSISLYITVEFPVCEYIYDGHLQDAGNAQICAGFVNNLMTTYLSL